MPASGLPAARCAVRGLHAVGRSMSDERTPPPRPRCRSLTGVRILGTGSYVPDAVVTNAHLHARLGHDSDWIVKRTGILERRHALPHQATSDLCHEAARRCLDSSAVAPADIDLLVLATFTPDMAFPSTACLLQDRLRLNCAAIEVEAACAGFMYALITGAAYVVSGASDLALIVGGDCNSRVVNPDDLKTYPLFGDGAGAVLLARGRPDQGILSYSLGSDGSGGDLLSRPACGSRLPPTPELLARGLHFMHMDGRGVFRWAVAILCDTIQRRPPPRRLQAQRRQPLHSPPGEHPHHQRRHRRFAHQPRQSVQQPGALRQHLGRLGPPRPRRGHRRGPRPRRRSAGAERFRRRPGLGDCVDSVVRSEHGGAHGTAQSEGATTLLPSCCMPL